MRLQMRMANIWEGKKGELGRLEKRDPGQLVVQWKG